MNWMYISEIVKRFKRQGLEEFARNKYTSHNRKLSYQQEEDILQECERKAEEGHITTVEEVRKALNAEIGGTTAVSYVYRVLKRHGWVKKMPRPKHPKSADEKSRLTQKIKSRYDICLNNSDRKRCFLNQLFQKIFLHWLCCVLHTFPGKSNGCIHLLL